MQEPVVIVDHDPTWRVTFEALRDLILSGLRGLPVAVEHVGSTAVPDLAAKPIIDMDVVVPTAAHVAEAIRRLQTMGYVHEGDLGITGREAFRTPQGDPMHHLYLCIADSSALREHRTFRDRLRDDPSLARRYADLKRRLAVEHGADRASYTESKSTFIRDVLDAGESEP